MAFPEPACTLGYTETQVGETLGGDVDTYGAWPVGKTQGFCEGMTPCAASHGIVDYPDDVERFLRSG